jgi:hypothetical protein
MDTHTHKPTLANSQTVPTGGFSRREILLFAAAASKPLDQAEDGAGHRYCTRHERTVFCETKLFVQLHKCLLLGYLSGKLANTVGGKNWLFSNFKQT